MSKEFLSWDCANRTLAWSLFTIDTHIYSKLSILADDIALLCAGKDLSAALLNTEFVEDLLFIIGYANMFLREFVVYKSLGVRDILKGKKVDETGAIERTCCLHSFLISMDELSPVSNYNAVIIEHQPNKIGAKTNTLSTAVGSQLAFYYVDCNPVLISPKLKNNITFRSDLTYDAFLQRELPKHKSFRDARYKAAKCHSRDNFIYFLSVFGLMHLIKDIPRAVMDDVADSTMQVFAYLRENKKYI